MNCMRSVSSDSLQYPVTALRTGPGPHELDRLALGGSHEIEQGRISADYAHFFVHQDRTGLDSFASIPPFRTASDNVSLRYLIPLSRLSFEPALEFTRYRFDNGTLLGQPIDQQFRNRGPSTPPLSSRGTNLRPCATWFSSCAASTSITSRPTRHTSSRDSTGWLRYTGIDYDFDGVVRARILAGYQQQDCPAIRCRAARRVRVAEAKSCGRRPS